MDQNTHTLSILVNNEPGVLMRVINLFTRRGYNIDSLSVSVTEDPEISRITIVVSATNAQYVEQIERQIEKLIDVIRVYEMPQGTSLQRELVLVKVFANEQTRHSIIELCEIFKAKIVDVSATTMTAQIVGEDNRVSNFLDLMKQYGICEMVRTGMTAMERGPRTLAEMEYQEI